MNPSTDIADYYARRAREYDRIYEKPERQQNLAALRDLLRRKIAGHAILEVACGTGYWSQVISASAKSILATDINEEVLTIARQKNFTGSKPTFQIADAYDLDGVEGKFTVGFAGFWWSHIAKRKLPDFLQNFHRRLAAGAIVVFLDNNFVEGSNTPIARRDDEGNAYQRRKLENGTVHEVLKNFPTDNELHAVLDGIVEDIETTWLQYYWWLAYRLPGKPAKNA